METEVTHNSDLQRFEYISGKDIAHLDYRMYGDNIAFVHTEVPPHLEGQGIASKMAKAAFAYAKSAHQPVMIYCSFVAHYVKEHPELKEQLDPKFSR